MFRQHLWSVAVWALGQLNYDDGGNNNDNNSDTGISDCITKHTVKIQKNKYTTVQVMKSKMQKQPKCINSED